MLILDLTAALGLAIFTTAMSDGVFSVNFGRAITLDQQKTFTKAYLAELYRHDDIAYVFDCRNIESVDPQAIIEHIKVFQNLKDIHRKKMRAFALVVTSWLVRNIIDIIFKAVPPSAPYVVVDNPGAAWKFVLSTRYENSSEVPMRF